MKKDGYKYTMKQTFKQSYPELLLLIPAILLIAFMHLWKLTLIPGGYNVDEIAIAYDAKCLAEYGVNRSGISYPFYLPNYGGSQTPLYTYSLVMVFRLFGASKLTLRLVAAFYAFLGAFFGYRFASLVWPSSAKKYLWIYLYAILPVFTMETRYAMDSHLLQSVSMIALYYAASALIRDRIRDYIATGICFGLCLYAYALAHVIVPIALIFILIYRLRMGRLSLRKITACSVPLFMMALPHILFQCVNLGIIAPFQIGPVSFIKPTLQRSSEFDFSHFLSAWYTFFRCTLGSDHLNYCTLYKFGAVYYLSIPFIILGFVISIRNVIVSWRDKKIDGTFVYLFWFMTILLLAGAMSGDTEPNSSRMNAVYPAYLFFMVLGLSVLRNRYLKIAVVACFSALFIWFASYYFVSYGTVGSVKYFAQDYSRINTYINQHAEEPFTEKTIYFNMLYPYYLWAFNIPPQAFTMEGDWLDSCGKDVLSFPVSLDLFGSYVIPFDDTGSIQSLRQCGFDDINLDEYHLMIGPLTNISQQRNTDLLFNMDSLDVNDDNYIFYGWSWNTISNAPFTSYLIRLNTYRKEFASIQRSDVADLIDVVTDPFCGFECSIPISVFRDQIKTSDLVIYGITETGEEIPLYTLSSSNPQ